MILFFRSATIIITMLCATGLLASCTATPAHKAPRDNSATNPSPISSLQVPPPATEDQKLHIPVQRHPTTQERIEQLQKDQLQAFTEKCTYSSPTVKTTTQCSTTKAPSARPSPLVEYTVQSGENLYSIAARANIYREGLLWPLIYKANRDQIKDPQQIFPGQTLTITRNHNEDEKEQARETARNSGIFKQQHEDEQTTPLSTR